MALPVSIQLYSIEDELEKDPRAVLRALSEMGYNGIEPHGGEYLYGLTADEFISLTRELGLSVPSAHISYETLTEKTDATLAFHKSLGCKYLAIPYMFHEKLPGGENHEGVYENMMQICRRAKDFGITLCYHNHEIEFTRLEGKYIMEHLLDNVPEMKAEYDTGWMMSMGEYPPEYLQAHADKCALIHLKDFYRPIGVTEGRPEFRPVGYGVQNIPHIMDAAEKAGAEWLVVEQDDPAFGLSRLETAEMSIKYIRTLQGK